MSSKKEIDSRIDGAEKYQKNTRKTRKTLAKELSIIECENEYLKDKKARQFCIDGVNSQFKKSMKNCP